MLVTERKTAAESIKLDGYAPKNEVLERLESDRMLISLSQAVSIEETGSYWVHLIGKELEPREVKGKGYYGRTFEDTPTEEGYYAINKDSTFTRLNNKEDVEWSERLYVSPLAASQATHGKDHAILYVIHDLPYLGKLDSFMNVFPCLSRPSNYARVASVPKPQVQQERREGVAAEAMRK